MFRYGAQKYGAAENNLIRWAIQIDWDADGVYDGTNEANYAIGMSVVRGRQHTIKQAGDGFVPLPTGRVDLTLDNHSRRFDPWFIHSPLFGNISPGRKARIWLSYQGVTRRVFAGYVSDIQPVSGDNRQVRVTILDGIQYLMENPVSVLIRENISISDGIGTVLDAISWPAIWGRSLDSGLAELPYWWADDESGQTAILKLADSNLGLFFVAADGKAKFYSRNHISTSVLTITGEELDPEVPIPQPWEVVRNTVRVVVHTLVTQTESNLWQLGDKPGIAPGESLELFANFSYQSNSCSAINVISPAATTDYLANSAFDGSGTNLTGSISITTTVFSKSAKLVITNNSATLAYITLLKIRGNPITESDPAGVEKQNEISQKAFGKRAFTLDNPWMQNINNATAFATMLQASMALPRAFPKISLEGRPDIQFTPDLFDAITMQVQSLGINDDYRLGRIQHQWLDNNGQSVRTTWNLETFENINESAWQFPTRIGISSKFAF
ncbi:MAG TPA: hypothetical protein VN364_08100 [Bellilinea sp.]|nr:hypothetical protein [Bellilinea sp.]